MKTLIVKQKVELTVSALSIFRSSFFQLEVTQFPEGSSGSQSGGIRQFDSVPKSLSRVRMAGRTLSYVIEKSVIFLRVPRVYA